MDVSLTLMRISLTSSLIFTTTCLIDMNLLKPLSIAAALAVASTPVLAEPHYLMPVDPTPGTSDGVTIRWRNAVKDPNVSYRLFFQGYYVRNGRTYNVNSSGQLRYMSTSAPRWQNLWITCNGRPTDTTLDGRRQNWRGFENKLCTKVFGRSAVPLHTNVTVYNNTLRICVPKAKGSSSDLAFLNRFNRCMRWYGFNPINNRYHWSAL